MNVKLLISSIVIAVAVFSSTAVLAKGHKSGVNIYRMLLSERAAEKLDLTATQQAKIKSIAESEKAVIELFKNTKSTKRNEVKAMVQAEVFDELAFRQAFLAGQNERLELAVLKAKNENAVWNTLTLEQQEKNESKMKKRKAKMAKKREK